MERQVIIKLSAEKAILLMDFLGMQSEYSVKMLADTIENSYSNSDISSFKDDYPDYDPMKAYEVIGQLHTALTDKLGLNKYITISI